MEIHWKEKKSFIEIANAVKCMNMKLKNSDLLIT